jgi:DNA-directed RNA polymerase specialized sigma24 family protein
LRESPSSTPAGTAWAWAFGIVAYEIRTLRRQEQRRRESPHDAAAGRAADLSQSPEALAVLEDLTRALTAALGQLSTADREVLLADDTGEISAPSPSALRKRRQRALERLRTAWRRLHA